MKKTQMIHSPRTFKLGLGLILAAAMASMPVLTGAIDDGMSDGAKLGTSSSTQQPSPARKQAASSSAKAVKKNTPANQTRQTQTQPADNDTGPGKTSGGDKGNPKAVATSGSAKGRVSQFEGEAKKIAATLTPTQRERLLALLNEARPEELASIGGVGKSRSAAIESARPIKSIEDLPNVKGVGIKTLAGIIDHAKSLTSRSAKPAPAKSKSPTRSSTPKPAGARSKTTKSTSEV